MGRAAVQWLELKSMLDACLVNPVLDGGLKYVEFYVCQGFEFDAIAGDAGFAEFLCKCLGQVLLVIDSHNVDGNAGCIRADTDLIELPGFSIGIFRGLRSISNVWVGNDFSFLVLAI